MTPLDAHAWETGFTDLRTPVLTAFPRLHRQDVEAAGGDFDALVHLIQRHSGLSATEVHARLSKIEVAEGEPVDGAAGADDGRQRADITQLRIAYGFEESERPRILELLGKLNRQLKRFPANGVDLELAVKDRDTTAQKVTLTGRLPNIGTVIATSREHALRDALMDVREDLWRQLKEQLDRRQR